MKHVLVSDLHIDIGSKPSIHLTKWPEGDLLLIAGDTANSIGALIKFLERNKDRYETILFVDGNHEHYGNSNQGTNSPEDPRADK